MSLFTNFRLWWWCITKEKITRYVLCRNSVQEPKQQEILDSLYIVQWLKVVKCASHMGKNILIHHIAWIWERSRWVVSLFTYLMFFGWVLGSGFGNRRALGTHRYIIGYLKYMNAKCTACSCTYSKISRYWYLWLGKVFLLWAVVCGSSTMNIHAKNHFFNRTNDIYCPV